MCRPTGMISINTKGLSGPLKSKRVLQVVKNKKFSVVLLQENFYRSAMKIFESNMDLKQYYHKIIKWIGLEVTIKFQNPVIAMIHATRSCCSGLHPTQP